MTMPETYLRLPRCHRRGPIEAEVRAAHLRVARFVFHAVIGVAPLKQDKIVRGVDGLAGGLPRCDRRGPIEAIESWRVASAVVPVFHAVIGVAPLKLLSDGQGVV